MEEIIIQKDPALYCAFPDIEKLSDEELAVVYREVERRKEGATHLDSSSRAVLARSLDGGLSWKREGIVYNDEDGIQDPSLTQLRDGTLVSNFFKWQVMKQEPFLHRVRGTYLIRSKDGGRSWSNLEKLPTPGFELTATSDAALELSSGKLLVPIYGQLPGEARRAMVAILDGGCWHLSTIAFDPLDNMDFGEPALCFLPTGRILCLLRVERVEQYLWSAYSDDAGETWSTPKRTDIWGFPPQLLVLHDGRILCSYGYRRPPFGVRACLSEDGGETWDLQNEIIIRKDGIHGDLGYPSSIELEKGEVFTTYYFHDRDSEKGVRYIAGSIYHL
jgi:sialidase-1